jgi:acyl carrier protein
MAPVAEIQKDILDYLESHFEIEPDKIESNAELNDLGIDSLGLISIANRVEERYGIALGDEWIDSVRTFQDFSDLLERKAAAGASPVEVNAR